MSKYCTRDDVSNVLPETIVIGTNLLSQNVNVTEDQADFWIDRTAGEIDSYLTAFYRVPFIKYKEPVDFSTDPVTFIEIFPHPLVLLNARLTAASLYDMVVSANQEPNVAEWGKNMRALAFDDLQQIVAGTVQLKNQIKMGMRFARQELFDPSRLPAKGEIPVHNRGAGS